MPKYHISKKGEPALCKASVKPCPRGGSDEHFESVEKTYEAISKSQGGDTPVSVTKIDSVKTRIREAEKLYGGKFVSPHEIKLSEGVETALEDIREIGNPLIVGGAVRDSFNGEDNKDIDIEVHGTDIDSIASTLRSKGYIVDEVGKRFGVLKVSKKGVVSDLDVSVPRRENRSGAGHRSFEVELDKEMTVREAATRRDFTFNAMSYDHNLKMLIDPAGGHEDFQNKVMRHVSEKFAEDPLRVLRGFQLAGRFKMTYDPETAKLAKSIRKEYSDLSTERVQEEWKKFFDKSSDYSYGVKALQDSGWDDTSPGLREAISKSSEKLNGLKDMPKEDRRALGVAVIAAHMDNKHYQEKFIQTSIDVKKERSKVRGILDANPKKLASSSFERKLYAETASPSNFTFKSYEDFGKLMNNSKILEAAAKAKDDGVYEKSEAPLVMGRDVLTMTDIKPGAWVSPFLNKIKIEQYKGAFKNKDEALEFARKELKSL